MSEVKQRKSNIELLRIIAMLMIVSSHYCVHGSQYKTALQSLNFDGIFLHSVILGNLGVDIFFMISGYFLSKSERPFKLHKALSLWLQVWMYSISIAIILLLFNMNIGKTEFIKSIFPTTFFQYDFFTVYLLIYFLSPFLNLLLKNLVRREFMILIFILILFVSVPETLLGRAYLDSYVLDAVICYIVFRNLESRTA